MAKGTHTNKPEMHIDSEVANALAAKINETAPSGIEHAEVKSTNEHLSAEEIEAQIPYEVPAKWDYDPVEKMEIPKEEIKKEKVKATEPTSVNPLYVDEYEDNVVSAQEFFKTRTTIETPTENDGDTALAETFPDGFRVLNKAEIEEYEDNAHFHYRLLEARKVIPAEVIANASLNKKIVMVEEDKLPTFQMNFTAAEATLNNQATNAVEVVAVQSGYKCLVTGMKYEELASFGRSHQQSNTYSYMIKLHETLFRHLRNFSIAPPGQTITFNNYLDLTSWYDGNTLIFGLYMACFPGVNDYSFGCDFCGKPVNVKIDNRSIMYIPPSDKITPEMIKQIIHNDAPIQVEQLVKEAKRYKVKRIWLSDRHKYIDIRIPSIKEFITKAYLNKPEDVIKEKSAAMFYAGHCVAAGIIDISYFSQSQEIRYLVTKNTSQIEKMLSELDVDDKITFDKEVNKFISENTLSYRLKPTVCPHCKNIMSQKEINTQDLFFDVRAAKGI